MLRNFEPDNILIKKYLDYLKILNCGNNITEKYRTGTKDSIWMWSQRFKNEDGRRNFDSKSTVQTTDEVTKPVRHIRRRNLTKVTPMSNKLK